MTTENDNSLIIKNYLRIEDMLQRLGVSRTQFWRMRKAGAVPPPSVNNPQLWVASKVNEFYENKSTKQGLA